MTEQDKRSPWLQAALAMNEDLKKELKEVQNEQQFLSRKVYPEEWKARREREERDS